ncbi:MAG TPA: hypothetical protein VK672_04850 [Solirubrobacteraceae bacterium]|jgi:hypothetical protein|nr:hypothetical protein [Solirubrobacteraceae bacterium]
MTVILISLVWFAALAALVARLATRAHDAGADAERSPRLLPDPRTSFEEAIAEVLEATPRAKSSKPATAEHVRDGAKQDLYVRP